jgi:hypothetical protein
MTEKDILRAIGGIDPSLILAAERVQKKISWKKWIATAACFLLIAFVAVGYYNVVLRGANSGDPGPQNYKFSTLAEMNAAIGKETLCNDNTVICDDDTVIRVSCFEDESGIIDLHKPSQLNVIAYDGDIRIEYYIIFGRDDVSQSYVGGYEEQNLRREINGITVMCFGNREGEATKTVWVSEGCSYAVLAYGAGGDEDFGLQADDLNIIVSGVK